MNRLPGAGPLIRATSLRGFTPLVERLGGDPAELLTRFGIPAGALDSDEAMVPITAHDLMLDTAASELDCPDFGLRLADDQDLTVLGPLALAIESSSTVAEALDCASQYLFVHSPALKISLEADPLGHRQVVALTYRKDLRESPYSPQAMELGVGVFRRLAEMLIEGTTGLRSVVLPHAPLSPVHRYREFFGVEVQFGREPAALRVERHLLEERFRSANESIRRVALDHLRRTYSDPEATVTAQVRGALADRLGTAPVGIDQIARLLSLHPRTLQRRLAAEGTGFEVILDDVRRTAAGRYVTGSDLPFARVAGIVGFSEQAAFSRAVRRWFGISPRELRRRGPPGLQA